MQQADETEFREFVSARMTPLRKSAYLLCGDRHLADDLVSAAVLKLYRNWRRVRRADHPDAYLRRILVNVWLDERRRPWRREHPAAELPEPAPAAHDHADRLALLAQLARLPPRRRAVLVLRYYEGLGIEETAQLLDLAPGTVKAHTHHALAQLRALLAEPAGQPTEPARRC
jgi:RNA polymerase sigma-70 factor (sigma-E family)